ncbi:hypothetical protein QR680_014861 [Steinernema hermaphroditum]|uniref:C-type lectin domain-containing protein n=1 Tax=Steinernema hermaphroditum TaxID=289476 RepID=A0AA39ICL2_9BILA|nr:hypothetical protein QR680_014861 [Steinernema hermaphroditum]
MDVPRMLPLLFLLISGSSAFNRAYKGGEALLKVIVRTSDCHHAGTDADVSSNPGFINERGILVWQVRMKALKGNAGENLERNTEQVVVRHLSSIEFAEIESDCARHANYTQEKYDDCFHANVILFSFYTWFGNLYPAWNPGKMEVQLTVRSASKGERITSVWPDASCEHNWITADDNGIHYLCKNEPPNRELRRQHPPMVNRPIDCH